LVALQLRLDSEFDLVDQLAPSPAQHAEAVALLTDYAEAARAVLDPPVLAGATPGARMAGAGAQAEDDGMGEGG
jgi:hypothetical protein